MLDIFATPAFVLIVVTTMSILIFKEWRINAIALGLQYLAAFVLISLSWQIEMSVVKLFVGWMVTTALALTCLRQLNKNLPVESTASLFFRALLGLMIIIVVFLLAPTLQNNVFPNVKPIIIQGGLMLCAMALVQLGTNSDPFLTIISLLTFFSGFEVIHAALEHSLLLTGLFVLINLGLALVGIYFIMKDSEKPEIQRQA